MHPNPILKKLGLSGSDRAVIIHADDIGMCQASLAAFTDLVDCGGVSAASTMVPCPWFPATAEFCRSQPRERVDMGVHLTLTSEFAGYRWGPISTRDPASGMIGPDGYFHAESQTVQAYGDPLAVQRELEAQVKRALEAGIDVTHIDTHMGSVAHSRFVSAYVQVALQHRIPPLLLRKDRAGLQEIGIDADTATLFARQLLILEAQGLPLLDELIPMPLEQPDNRLEQVKRVLSTLPAGVSYLIIHPAQDTPELRAITSSWRGRVADYETFSSQRLAGLLQETGVHVIGWRVLRDLMRQGDTP